MTAQTPLAPGQPDELTVASPRIGDAFGELVARCWANDLRPGSAFYTLERNDGFILVTDAVRWFNGPDLWPGPERWACEQATGRILDIGCGTGRHSIVLAGAGHDVLGLDSSPGAVNVARQRGLQVVQGRLGEVDTLGTFDTLLLLGNNLGLLQSRQAAPAVLAQLARVASPGAQILANSRDPEYSSVPEQVAYRAWNRSNGQLPGYRRVRVRHRCTTSPWFDYLFASVEEIAKLVQGSPWTLAESCQEGAQVGVRLVLKD